MSILPFTDNSSLRPLVQRKAAELFSRNWTHNIQKNIHTYIHIYGYAIHMLLKIERCTRLSIPPAIFIRPWFSVRLFWLDIIFHAIFCFANIIINVSLHIMIGEYSCTRNFALNKYYKNVIIRVLVLYT